ncbi:MAG: response regulator [Sandaracinaceae bacterium]
MKILLVDDDEAIRSSLGRYLRSRGHELSTAADGEEGWQLLREHEFDAVVSDVRMPRLPGPEMVRRMRSAGLQTPVVLIAGAGDDATEALSAELGHCATLAKPFRLARLAELLAASQADA